MPRLFHLLPLLALAITSRAAPAPATATDLAGIAESKDAAEFASRVADARKGLESIDDPALRALTMGTLESLAKRPGDMKAILATHAARVDEIVHQVPETLFLSGLPECRTDADVVSYARRTYPYVQYIKDPVLASTVRFTLAKLEDAPKDAKTILTGHLRRVGARFHASANEAFAANNAQGCLEAVQIAIRCDPANSEARLLFAHLLQSAMGETAKAIQTLKVGLNTITPADKNARPYLERYFRILESREEEEEVIKVSDILLKQDGFDSTTREMLAMHNATCLYWLGRFDPCIAIIAKHQLGARPQGRLLEARALFDGKRTEAATRLLDKSVADFTGDERDVILGQLQRFWTDLGRDTMALSVAEQRIRENPTKGSPRVHRLWLFERQGDAQKLNREVRKLLEESGHDQSVLMGIAQFAAERARPDLADDCLRRALESSTNRPVFGLLAMEAHVTAREYAIAIDLHNRLVGGDRTFFRDVAPTENAILAAAKLGRGDPISRSEAERHIKAFLETPKLTPDAYVASARLIRRAGDTQLALMILEKGRAAHDWHNQLRADLAAVRIMTGNTAAYGTRPPIEEELAAIAAARRVSPRLWETASTWLDTEAHLPDDKLRELRELVARHARPDLSRDVIGD